MLERIKKSLAAKTAAFFLLAAMLPYVLLSLFFFHSSRKALSDEILKGLESSTGLIRDAIDARIFLLRSNAVAWADMDVMKDILTDDVDKRIANVLSGLKEDYDLKGNIYVFNGRGAVVASTAGSGALVRVNEPWTKDVLSGRVIELDARPSLLDGSNVVVFAVPVKPTFMNNRTIGALALEYRVEDLKRVATPGAGAVFIFKKTGEEVTSFPENDASVDVVSARSFKTGKKGGFRINGYIGAIAYAKGYYDFKGFGWGVVAAVHEEKALYPVKKMERGMLIAGFAGGLLIVGLVYAFARRTTRPLEELSDTADRIAMTKDFSVTVSTASTDEVGRLADAFNRMVSEVRSYLERIKEMEEEIRRADRLSALGEFSAGMAHEIKNPLGIIKSSADILISKLGGEDTSGRLVAAISEEAGRLEDMLEAFLQFARPRPPEVKPCNVNEEVEKVLTLFEMRMLNSGIIVEKKLDPELAPIMTDGGQLRQVLVNLIINSVQAMPGGGRLSVETKSSLEYPLGEPYWENPMAVVSVADSGGGIPPEFKGRIFNPFFTTKEKGTGLGLSIVSRIITGLDGWVRVEDAAPAGTVFRIYLPLRRSREAG
ncbi:MAG TPA: ATP-binding protein [Thermodesulfobacteriota bacterium]|nr:ATP-binding protein [Thermodesulfobacteriota bacterium]